MARTPKAPTTPSKPCQDCGATEQIYIIKHNNVNGYKGYHCPMCLATTLAALKVSYKYVIFTITNSEA